MQKKLLLVILVSILFIVPLHAQNFLGKFKSVGSFAKLGNTLFFAADDGTTGVELWKTDGTVAGTVLVKDINQVSANPSSNVSELIAFNGKLYFSADDGVNGAELWTSDGTAAGTKLLKNICTELRYYSGSSPGQFTICNGVLYFAASETNRGVSLWRTDGTAVGTIRLTDDDHIGVSRLTAVGQSLYFVIGSSLWRTDGTSASIKQVTTDDYYLVDLLKNVDGELVFITNTTYRQNIRLYKLNPTNDTPLLLKSFDAVQYGSLDIDNITSVGANFYFSIRTVDANDKGMDAVWKSDKTSAGTVMVKSFSWTRYIYGSSMENFVAYNNKLYFSSTGTHNLYTTDGTDAGTLKVPDAVLTQGFKSIQSGQKVYYNVSNQLWSYDGSILKKEFDQPMSPLQLFDLNGKVYFTVGDDRSKTLWNNDASPGLLVRGDFALIPYQGNIAFSSKKDSVSTSNVTISNPGSKPLLLSEISVAGDAFYLSGKTEQTLAPGAQVAFKVVYYPAKEQVSKGTLNIKSNTVNDVYTISLTGETDGKARKPSVVTDGLTKSIVFNDSQSSFTLSNNIINENSAAGSIIGSFAFAGTGGPFTYSLVPGTGDIDNAIFNIINGQLKPVLIFDYEEKNTYTVRVKATGSAGTSEKVFVIKVADVPKTVAQANCARSGTDLTFDLLDAAYFANALVAVCSNGKIIRSVDNGQHWSMIKTTSNSLVSQLAIADDHTAYASYGGGNLLKTEDSGATWSVLDAPAVGWRKTYFYSANVGFLLSDGAVYKTVDGGKSWIKKAISANGAQLNAIWFTNENTGYICGSARTYLKTTDGGATWQNADLGVLGDGTNLASMAFTNTNTGYILSTSGDFLQTKDAGATWKRISIVGGSGPFYFKNETEGYALNSSEIYKTIDGGLSWQKMNTDYRTFQALAISKTSNNYCLVGYGNGIYVNHGTDTWSTISYIPKNDFSAINFIDDDNGYAFGGGIYVNWGIYKTSDGGITWQTLGFADSRVFSSHFINKDKGFYTTRDKLFRTTDGGKTWEDAGLSFLNSISSDILFTNDQTGFVTADGYLFKTTDGGLTWQTIKQPLLGGTIWSSCFLDSQTGFVLNYRLVRITDGGNTWTDIPLPDLINHVYTSVYFLNKDIGFVGDSNGVIARTTDGGTTWNFVVTPINSVIRTFSFVDDNHGYALANPNSGISYLLETFDAGLSWKVVSQTSATTMQVLKDNVFLGSYDGIITRLSAPENALVTVSINGSTNALVADKYNYTLPSIPNTIFTWAVSGPADIEYVNNGINVTWKQKGNYTVTATPSAPCTTGMPNTLNVVVAEVSKPIITSYYLTGPATAKSLVINGSNFNSITNVKVGNKTAAICKQFARQHYS